jgi:hypothetical protein
MKNFLFIMILVITGCFYATAQVGIGTTNPSASSMLDVTSTTKGLLVPRMTTAQRNAIPSPATGLLIYQTDGSPGLFYNSGTPASPVWILAGSSTGQWLANGTSIYYNNGHVGIGTSAPSKPFIVKSGVLSDDMAMFLNGTDDYVLRFRQNSNGSGSIYVYDGGNPVNNCNIYLYGGGNSYIRSGRFGLGNTSPDAGLHLYGTAFPESFMYIEGATGIDAGLRLYEAGTAKWHFYNDVGAGGLNILNNASVSVLFAKQSNAYLGIGTTNPVNKLDVRGDASVSAGSFGVGTTNPLTLLDVRGTTAVTSGFVGVGTTAPMAGVHVKGTAFPASFLFLEGGSGVDAGMRLYEGATAKWHIFHNTVSNGLHIFNGDIETAIFARDDNGYVGINNTTPERHLDVKGNMVVRNETTNDIVVELGTGLDYAEGFNVADLQSVEPGTVMSIDPGHPGLLAICNEENDYKVAGIVAGTNSLGSGIILGSGSHQVNVALAGRVYCKADACKGAISVGDLLTTSDLPGYAKRAGNGKKAKGAILGKAMESLSKGQTGQILVLVTLQ